LLCGFDFTQLRAQGTEFTLSQLELWSVGRQVAAHRAQLHFFGGNLRLQLGHQRHGG